MRAHFVWDRLRMQDAVLQTSCIVLSHAGTRVQPGSTARHRGTYCTHDSSACLCIMRPGTAAFRIAVVLPASIRLSCIQLVSLAIGSMSGSCG